MYRSIQSAAPQEAVGIEKAVTFLKEHARKSFNETIEIHVRLGVDAGKSDQIVRGNVTLPSGSVKQKRVAVFTSDEAESKAAKEAGASLVGGQELIDQIAKEGKLDADVAVASPEMMPKIAKVARVLGPQGLMPNPKTGTVNPKPSEAVKDLLAGKISFKMDSTGNVHEAVGKADWEDGKIIANVSALLEAIRASRPSTAKGEFIKKITLSSTMGVGIKIAS